MMKKVKTILGIYTCPKFQNRAKAVQNTWLPQIDKNDIGMFVLSDEGGETRVEGDHLFLDCPEGYENLPVKTYHFIKYCLDHYDFEYIFKVDDDAYVHMQAFNNFVRTGDYIGTFAGGSEELVERTYHYGKFSNGSLEKPYTGKYIASWAKGGDGYFLNRNAAEVFIENAVDIVKAELVEPLYCGYEDKMVGDVLATHSSVASQKVELGAFGSIHPIDPIAMRAIHRQFNCDSQS